MQVTCPNCGARYAVDPLAIGPSGRTVQCVRCSHRWYERPVAAAAAAPAPRPVPDFVVRPPSYNAGLPALATPPATSHWGRWLTGIVVTLVVLTIAAYALRHQILQAMPADWRSQLDVLSSLLRR